MTSNLSIAKNVALAGVALTGSYCVPYVAFKDENNENVKRYLISYIAENGQAYAATPETAKPPKNARDVAFLTANFIYETKGYEYDHKVQEDAFRYIGTSVINKKAFEGHRDFASVIAEKQKNPKTGRVVCQFSWVCEQGKPVDLKQLQKKYPESFSVAYQMAVDMVEGKFRPIPNFDGIYYVREDVYNNGKSLEQSWHRKKVAEGTACKRRTIDSHVFIAPKKAGTTCKQNQLQFYTASN